LNYKKVLVLFELLPKSGRKKFLSIVLFALFNSFVDISILSSLFPLMYIVTHRELIFQNKYIYSVYEYLNFKNDSYFIIFLFVVMIGLFAFRALMAIYISNKKLKLSFQIGDLFFSIASRNIFYQNIIHFKKLSYGEIDNKVRIAPYWLSSFYLFPLSNLLTEIFVLTFLISGLFIFNYILFLILVFFVFVPSYVIYIFIKRKISIIGKEIYNESKNSINASKNSIRAYVDVFILNKQEFFIEKLFIHLKKYNQLNQKVQIFQQSLPRLLEWIAIVSIFILFLIYQVFRFNYDEIILALTAYFATAYRVLPSISRINASLILMKQYEYLVDEFKKLKELTKIPKQIINNDSNKISFSKFIRLTDISLSYSEDKQKKVLNQINLEIKKSEVLGIVGESGSGKTTLMYVIAGLIFPDEGYVEVDGVKINENNVLSWYKHISIVFQEPYIIDGNWIDNIAFGGQEIDKDKIWECLRLVQLESYVKKLPHQLYEQLGENGSFLSGGQKQRLAIARALYREADVLLLDEATSALDEETQLEIMQAIENIQKERQITVVIIAHRYSSLKFCDRIIKLDKGTIQKELRYQDLIDPK